MQKMVIPMQLKPKKLGITQLSRSLFVLAHKNIYGKFHNSLSIPPSTDLDIATVWVSWRLR
jgi:hypothetical protein